MADLTGLPLLLPIVLLVGALAAAPVSAQIVLTPSAHAEPGYTTDAIAIGDVHPAAGDELVVVAEGSTWYESPALRGTGRVLVLDADLNVLTRFDAPALDDLMGLPLITQLDSGPGYLVGTFAQGGTVYANTGTTTTAGAGPWSRANRDWAGLYNQGASAGNLLTGGGDEIVIPSWDGLIEVVSPGGVLLATYDMGLGTAFNERLYGHAAIANVDGVSGAEVLVVGHSMGTVVALSPDGSGGMTPVYVAGGDGPSAFGSGPAVADIDGDGLPEIIVALTGAPTVRAYDPIHGGGSTACEYEWPATGASDFVWSSPVVGDVDGDGDMEVVVVDTTSQVFVLSAAGVVPTPGSCAEGNYEAAHTVQSGGRAWFTPALADVTGDAAPDIVVASHERLQILDVDAAGTVALTHQADDTSASFYPSASVVPGLGGARATIFVSGWRNGNVYRFDVLGAGATDQSWPQMMNSNARRGVCEDGDCSTCSGGSCSEPCNGNCTCDQPGCNCDMPCEGNCDPECLAGATCEIDCAPGTDCKPNCEGGSTCEVTCDGVDQCEVQDCTGGSVCGVTCEDTEKCGAECTEGATCDIQCTGGDGQDCDVKCETGSDCSVGCDGVEKCDVKDCKDGATCDVECQDTEDCETKCKDGAACSVACVGEPGDTCDLECDNATCDFVCDGVERCDQTKCKDGATCELACTDVERCELDCENGAACLLHCGAGNGSCAFDKCDGTLTDCLDGTVACNRACPAP